MNTNKPYFIRTLQALALIYVTAFSVNVSAATCPSTVLPGGLPPGATCDVGASLFVQADGPIVAQFLGGGAAGFTNTLYLDSPANSLGAIFVNQTSVPGNTNNLGNFTAGTELIFRIEVGETGNIWKTGPGTRNPADDQAHAGIIEGLSDAFLDQYELLTGLPNNTLLRNATLVGFEDLHFSQWVGGEPDYNDLSFLFSNLGSTNPNPVPIPAAVWLFGSGLLGLIGVARRKA